MKLLSITECARRRGVTRATIHAAIQRKALAAQRVGHTWVITEEACDAYQPVHDPHTRGELAAAARWGKRHREGTPQAEGEAGDRDAADTDPTA